MGRCPGSADAGGRSLKAPNGAGHAPRSESLGWLSGMNAVILEGRHFDSGHGAGVMELR
jgi:hypothetical protein